MQTEIILFLPNYLLQLETLGACKIDIFRSTSVKLDSLNLKLHVDFKNGLNLENYKRLQTSLWTLIPRFFLRHPLRLFYCLNVRVKRNLKKKLPNGFQKSIW